MLYHYYYYHYHYLYLYRINSHCHIIHSGLYILLPVERCCYRNDAETMYMYYLQVLSIRTIYMYYLHVLRTSPRASDWQGRADCTRNVLACIYRIWPSVTFQ